MPAVAIASARPSGNSDVVDRLRIVLAAETRRPNETLHQVRGRFLVGRTFLYEVRQRCRKALLPQRPGPNPELVERRRQQDELEQLRLENQRLHTELARAQAKLLRCVEVTPERLLRTTLELALSPVSTRDTHTVLVEAFGAAYAVADNTVGRWINELGALAGRILRESGAHERIEHAAPDEIFFHQQPILCVAEPRTLTIAALERSDQRDGDAWEIVLSRLSKLKRATSDLGRGILAALGRLKVTAHADVFHGLRDFRAPETKLEKRARAAWENEDQVRGRMHELHRRGRKPMAALAKAKAHTTRCLDDLEHLLVAKELFAQATSPFNREHRLATRSSQSALVEEARRQLRLIKAPVWEVKQMEGLLRRNTDRFVAFTEVLWDIPVRWRGGPKSGWNARQIIAAAAWPKGLCAALGRARRPEETQRLSALLPRAFALRAEALKRCENFNEVEATLHDKLNNLERASSAVEMINSKLRPLQAIKKQVSQSFLNLFALKHNLTPFERSAKRAGRSPFALLGVKLPGDEGGWLGVLMARARAEGLL